MSAVEKDTADEEAIRLAWQRYQQQNPQTAELLVRTFVQRAMQEGTSAAEVRKQVARDLGSVSYLILLQSDEADLQALAEFPEQVHPADPSPPVET